MGMHENLGLSGEGLGEMDCLDGTKGKNLKVALKHPFPFPAPCRGVIHAFEVIQKCPVFLSRDKVL